MIRNAFTTIACAGSLLLASLSFAQTPPPAKSPSTPPPPPAPAATPAPPAPAAAPAAPAAKPAAGDQMEGLGAVYSNKLSGRKTASGQRFDQGALTAAHPSLAFGTKVKVTNTKNNRSVVVRINDRGPTQAGRVIDLSRAAASKIGIGPKAMAPVKLEVAEEAPPKKAKAPKQA
jgi:rare lipoprotein A